MPQRAASPPGISSTACRSARSATARSCKTVVAAAGAGDEPAGQRAAGARRAHTAARRSRPTRQAPALQAASSPRIDGAAADHRARACPPTAPTDEAGVSALHRLLERQHYRLAYWRLAVTDINYRRFFDINELAGLRVEDRARSARCIALVARLIADGPAAGAAARPHRRAARSAAIHSAAAAADPQRAARGAAGRSTSWSRKSSPKASALPRFPASPAPPATNG